MLRSGVECLALGTPVEYGGCPGRGDVRESVAGILRQFDLFA